MKFEKIPENVMIDLMEAVEGSSADALWSYIRENMHDISNRSYEERKHYFLSVMYRLMKEGRLKLANIGKFLEGTIEEQVEQYSDQWPKEESLLDRFDFQFTVDPDGNLVDFWPGGRKWGILPRLCLRKIRAGKLKTWQAKPKPFIENGSRSADCAHSLLYIRLAASSSKNKDGLARAPRR